TRRPHQFAGVLQVSSGLGARRPRLEVAPRITPRVPRRNSGDGSVAIALEQLRDCRSCARNLAGLGDDQGDVARSGCGPRAWSPVFAETSAGSEENTKLPVPQGRGVEFPDSKG